VGCRLQAPYVGRLDVPVSKPPACGRRRNAAGLRGLRTPSVATIIGAATATGGGTGSTGCGAVSVGGTTAEEVSGPGVDEGELSGVAEFATLEGSEQEAPTAVANPAIPASASNRRRSTTLLSGPSNPAGPRVCMTVTILLGALRAARSGRGSAPHFWPGLHVRPTASSMRCATFNSRASSPHGARSCRPIGSPV